MSFIVGTFVAAAALAVGAFIGFLVGTAAGQSAHRDEIERIKRHKLEDQMLYLGVLRRELANILIQRDPDRFLQFYSELFNQLADMLEKPTNLINAEEKLIIEKYPLIADWDRINTHDYVLYENNLIHTEAELYSVYRDLVIYQSILTYEPATSSSPASWKPVINRKRVDHLREYVSELKGTRLKHRLLEAMRQVEVHKNEILRLCSVSKPFSDAYYDINLDNVTGEIQTFQFTAYPVAVSVAESGYHFKFLDGEEGMVGIFYDDRVYVSVYGVDRETKSPTTIPTLSLDRLSVPYEYRADVALGYSRKN